MKKLELYRIKLTLESPLLIGYSDPSHNYFKTLSYIPSTSIRGALATILLENFCSQTNNDYGNCTQCNEKSQCNFYKYVYQNIFTITDGIYTGTKLNPHECKELEIIPSHPLLQKCKVCHSKWTKEEDENVKKRGYRLINNLVQWTKQNYIIASCSKCSNKTTLDPIQQYYCKKCKTTLNPPPITTLITPGINYYTKSSLEEYLFQYDIIEPESIFEAYLTIESNNDVLNLLNNTTIRIGRGKSRGFGKINLKLEKLDLEKKISENKKVIQNYLKDNQLIIAAKTRIFSLELNGTSKSGIVSNILIDLNKAISHVSQKLMGKKASINNTFILEGTIGDFSLISGWSLKSDQPKPHVPAANPGTLFKFLIKSSDQITQDILDLLAYMEFIGLNNYSQLGYNLMYYPLKKEEIVIRE
ncbi:MAG: RAMP superfamily CRISPR-associated protein [Promethearchaeota archaeon]